MEKLITALKDWCSNSYEFSEDLQEEAYNMVHDVLSEDSAKYDLDLVSKKVAFFMENWVNNENNQRINIEISPISVREESLDKLIRLSF